jgi:glyoxylase I family protein
MTVPFTIQALDHVVLRVADPDGMTRFYCDVLGCTVEKIQEKIGLIQLRAGSALIDLLHPGDDPNTAERRETPNMDHFCLTVEPFDGTALAAHLRAHGVEPGEPARRYGATGYGLSIYLSDPEGNMVELKGPQEDNLSESP